MKEFSKTFIDPALSKTRPEVHVTISREFDRLAGPWDFHLPKPGNAMAYDWTLKVETIRNGRMYSAETYLGYSWCVPSEPVDDINGYYPDMLREALASLDKRLAEVSQ